MLQIDFRDGQGYVPARRHPNGGGIVALTAEVEDTVYLSSESMVYGYARIKDRVRIAGRTKISGKKYPCGLSTLIEGDASICGNIEISCCVLIGNSAEIRGNVKLSGGVQVLHHAVIDGNVELSGDVLVLDQSFISGNITIVADDKQLVIKGDDSIQGTKIIKTAEQLKSSIYGERTRRRGRGKSDVEVREERVLGI